MHSDGSSFRRTQSGVVRVKRVMDPGNSSCSRTRSGLVRRNNIIAGSCSRTRSGLVRVKSCMVSSDSSCSKTRSGLVKIKSFMEDSGDGSCPEKQDDAKAPTKDEAVMKGHPDGWMKEDMPVGTRNGLDRRSPAAQAVAKDEAVMKELPDGWLKEEMPSRTRSGLVRGSPTVKAVSKAGPVINGLHDGWQGEDILAGTRSGLVRGSPAVKTLSKDQPVIKGLADGWLKEDKPLGTRSGLVRGSLAAKVDTLVNGQSDGWLKNDKPVGTRSGLFGARLAFKTPSNDETVMEGLPDGWRKEYRPRKAGSCQKSDPYYIDPVSGYEFRSMKDVRRYLQTGDIKQCAVRPKKNTIYDVCITENQIHTSTSSQCTRPSTVDKAIQCEILTSEGIMLSWEELVTPYRENNTELTVSPESESMKAMQGHDKLETLEHKSSQPVSTQRSPRQTRSVKRKEPNVEVKSKKRKTSPSMKPVRASPRLAALNIQHEVSVEADDQPISVNLVIEENTNGQSQMSQPGTMNQIHGNEECTLNQSRLSQADTANGMQATQEITNNHSQTSQADTLNHIQTNQENIADHLQLSLADTVFPARTMLEYTTDQLSEADVVNDIQTNQENTANQLQSSLADTAIPMSAVQEYFADCYQPSNADNQENTANQLQSSLEYTSIPIQIQEYTTDISQLSKVDTMNKILANQENTADQLHLSQAGTATQIQTMQENVTKQSQLIQADTMDQIHINLDNNTNHFQPNYAGNPIQASSFSWAPEQNGGAPITDFWKNVESQDSSVPMQIDGAPIASFPANVKFQNAATAEPALPTQAALTETASDQSGLAFQSLFGNAWSDPCIEFAFKTLTGDIPVLDDTTAVTDYFPEHQDLNKGTTPNCSSAAFDNTRNRTQVDVNVPVPTPSDNLYSGSWFPPQ